MNLDELQADGEVRIGRRSKLLVKTAITIGLLGCLLTGSAITSIIFTAIPLQIAKPEWQLNLIGNLVSSNTTLLIAAGMVALAFMLHPQDRTLSRWAAAIGRMAGIYAMVLVILIPLQFFLGDRVMQNQRKEFAKPLNQLKTIANKVKTLNSEAELRAYFASLPNAPTLPAKLDAEFPAIKQRVLDNIQARVNAGSNNLDLRSSDEKQIFLKEAVRNTAQLILMAAGFSAVANLTSKARNFVTDFFNSLL